MFSWLKAMQARRAAVQRLAAATRQQAERALLVAVVTAQPGQVLALPPTLSLREALLALRLQQQELATQREALEVQLLQRQVAMLPSLASPKSSKSRRRTDRRTSQRRGRK